MQRGGSGTVSAIAHSVARHKAIFFREKDAAGNKIDYRVALGGGLQLSLTPKSDLDVRVTSDEAAITDWISSDAADLLEYFSNLANMSTGAGHPLDFQRWARFLVQAHKEGAALHSSFLSRWLIEELRWPADHANDLARDYQFARDLLKVYDEST